VNTHVQITNFCINWSNLMQPGYTFRSPPLYTVGLCFWAEGRLTRRRCSESIAPGGPGRKADPLSASSNPRDIALLLDGIPLQDRFDPIQTPWRQPGELLCRPSCPTATSPPLLSIRGSAPVCISGGSVHFIHGARVAQQAGTTSGSASNQVVLLYRPETVGQCNLY
jgi:hypothetical protein